MGKCGYVAVNGIAGAFTLHAIRRAVFEYSPGAVFEMGL